MKVEVEKHGHKYLIVHEDSRHPEHRQCLCEMDCATDAEANAQELVRRWNSFEEFPVDSGEKYPPGWANTPWYKRGKDGWPIETFKNKPFKSAVRIICQNIRKLTG